MAAGPTWAEAQMLMRRGGRSDAWRDTGCWALSVLEDELGADWPALTWEKHGRAGLPLELMLSAGHIIAYRYLLDLALRLRIARGIPGAAKLRKAIRANPTPGTLYHARLQLELVALAFAAGHSVELESHAASAGTPSDVVIHVAGATPLPIETFVGLVSDAAKTADGDTDEVFATITSVHIRHNVGITGHFDSLEATARAAMLDDLEAAARFVSAGGSERVVAGEGFVFQVSAEDVFEVKGPAFVADPWSRLSRRLLQKARQAESSGARWLRVDALDGLWQLTPWALTSLTEKAATLAAAIQSVLYDAGELDGVVITSGLVLAPAAFENEEILDGRTCALRRISQPSCVRESILIPLRHRAQTDILVSMYQDEPRWLGHALASAGLPSPSALFGTD